ncbi:RING-type E3 ubiquitin-protein ligase PPIL2-like isoform X2 [Tachysurus fulvidraco]|uniref:RING-type E3 ubiquitin-protein ligase PPIL2-like isoform X2 n=1 Tax=Tachysurus fulvidraco TaxID=1234273 RepID=UPI001FF01591|nr:RING-type E3 ubiquitin-protein ligase PPIL2-like isoform X2 [Tachysurus fulvidraco]
MKVLDPDEEKAKQDPAYHLKSTNLETRETLAELYKEYKGDELLASTMKEPEAKKTDKFNARERESSGSNADWQARVCFHLHPQWTSKSSSEAGFRGTAFFHGTGM